MYTIYDCKAKRELMSISSGEMAQVLGVSKQTVINIENGKGGNLALLQIYIYHMFGEIPKSKYGDIKISTEKIEAQKNVTEFKIEFDSHKKVEA